MYLARKEVYDAIVVGSGMSGGIAAKELCEKGLKTLVLDRGQAFEHGDSFVTEHKKPWELPRHGRVPVEEAATEQPIQSKVYLYDEATKHLFINDRRNPYVQEKPFDWIQANQVGGRSLMWARQCYRWSQMDFEANAADGYGVDWPIRYEDIAPWYDYAERFVGVNGEKLGLAQVPDGQFLPPMEMNAVEKHAKARIESAFPGRNLTIGRNAVLTEELNGRAPCHYCGECERGCSTRSFFSSVSVSLPAAEATGNMTLRPNSIVHSLIYSEETDRVTGVRVIDAETREMLEYFGNMVFMCASCLGTTRIMLNTKTPRFSDGIGNSSGALGHYLMDHCTGFTAQGFSDDFGDRYYTGNRPNGIYIPRFRNLPGGEKHPDYVRGFGYQGAAWRAGWGRGAAAAGIGAELKERLRDPGPWEMQLWGFSEALPVYENHCRLSDDQVDEWGIPLLITSAEWTDNERAMRADMGDSAREMFEACGFRDISISDTFDETYPGIAIHEMGTARMGKDRQTSILNGHNQCHDVPNLFVTDGACMTSSACQNPSITYMALTARAVEYAVAAASRGEL